jgi:hypothetical protein
MVGTAISGLMEVKSKLADGLITMTTEERLLKTWRTLPPSQQQEVIAFTERLTNKSSATPDSPLGEKLRAIRARIVDSGIPLLSDTELEKEIAERRGERDSID